MLSNPALTSLNNDWVDDAAGYSLHVRSVVFKVPVDVAISKKNILFSFTLPEAVGLETTTLEY